MHSGAIVYWIETASGELYSRHMTPSDVRGGATYESEVRLKFAIDPLQITTIYLSRAGNDWERSEVERLKALSEQIRARRGERG